MHSHKPSFAKLKPPPRDPLAAPIGMQTLSAETLDSACRQGCSDPKCTLNPQEHWGMGIEPACHETNRICALYDSRHKTIEFNCGVCGAPMFRVKIQ
jgi:hypothetical protein